MYEFDSVSVSTYEATSLAAKLTEKSGDGWEVVAIVPSGSDITAFLKRTGSAATTDTSTEEVAAATVVSEPAGWGSAPEASSSSWGSSTDAAATTSAAPAAATPTDYGSGSWGSSSATPVAPAAAAPATPSVPAGWYADPANRYELRYWDGSAWTEHVSRAGQQYTDPPVA